MIKRVLKITAWSLSILLLLLVGLIICLEYAFRIDPPVKTAISFDKSMLQVNNGVRSLGKNWFRKNEHGLYELYVEGKPYERGVAAGLLTQDLLQYQEKVFQDQIHKLVPSKVSLYGLRFFVGWFNRNLHEQVSEEYKREILGLSESASPEYDYVGSGYQRMLNYHAAHDIGHALQNMSLVACTSFATWGDRSQDGDLFVGRNFDFYVGDEFAKNKIVAFFKPDSGYKFMMITFGGMAGVLSGMNQAGLTVTINAAKSEIPGSSATPVSLVAREILQYASTIDEAYAIAKKRKLFVAESFLIGSAKDQKASIIEKNTEVTALYESSENFIMSTNHFQSDLLGQSELNREHIRASASAFRYARVAELLNRTPENNAAHTVAILRDRKGTEDTDIGLGNERSINQLIAHHSVVFNADKQLVWVSTGPWQLGKFIGYDLNKIFSLQHAPEHEVFEDSLTIAEDPFLYGAEFKQFLKGAQYRFPFGAKESLNPDSVIHWNPKSYFPYLLSGDYYFNRGEYAEAKMLYQQALGKIIATAAEKAHIERNLQISLEKLK